MPEGVVRMDAVSSQFSLHHHAANAEMSQQSILTTVSKHVGVHIHHVQGHVSYPPKILHACARTILSSAATSLVNLLPVSNQVQQSRLIPTLFPCSVIFRTCVLIVFKVFNLQKLAGRRALGLGLVH